MKKLILLLLILLSTLASAVELDGKTVILLVSEHRSGDPKMEAVKSALLAQRTEMGMNTETMPIVFMGFKDSDTERKYFDRLGFQDFDSPVLCVVEWGNPARFGPKQVLDYAIYRTATPQHVDFIIKEYLSLVNKSPADIGVDPPPISPDASGDLEIINVRFEASGKPLFLTNAGIRLQNTGVETVRDISIRFYSKTSQDTGWSLMGKKTLNKLVSGYFASRDIVGDTRQFKLTDAQGNAIPCRYRIEVEFGGKIIYEEGEFVPNESAI
jgi:hypothetical protein